MSSTNNHVFSTAASLLAENTIARWRDRGVTKRPGADGWRRGVGRRGRATGARHSPDNSGWASRGRRSCWRTTCAARWPGARALCATRTRRTGHTGSRGRTVRRKNRRRCTRRRAAATASGWALRRFRSGAA